MSSGEATNTFFLCQGLANVPGLETHLLTTRQSSHPALPGIVVHDRMRTWGWTEVPKLLSTLRDVRPHAVLLVFIGGIYDGHSMITYAPAFAKRALPGVRFITRFEWPAGARRASLPSRALRKLLSIWRPRALHHYGFGTLISKSDAIITLSDAHAAEFLRREPGAEQRLSVIPPASNIPVVPDPDGQLRTAGRRRIGAHDDDFVIGYFGYLYPTKGVEVLLESFREIRERDGRARLLVVGGPGGAVHRQGVAFYQEMQDRARSLGLSESITWLGEVSVHDTALPSYVHAADVWALPFDRGVQPNNSSFSALASYGVPLVTTRTNGSDSMLTNGEHAMLCEPQNVMAMTAAIEVLRTNPSHRRRLGRSLGAFAADFLSWERVIDRTLAAVFP